jgi:hypothetical protein|tara:strand:+ start:4450 stop:4689 length:240 start_codon:yes stop_codon:yes gene_type:complete
MEEWFSAYPNSILEFSNKYYSIPYGTDEIMWVFYPFDIGEDLSEFDFEDYDEIENNDLPELDWREMTDDDDLDWIEIIP